MRVSGIMISALAIASVAVAVEARTLRSSDGPAEIPPSSFKALQYVDSKGCAFIRAGYGGRVTWVPRVERSRKVICGQKPTLVAGASKPVAPKAKSAVISQKTATVIPRAKAKTGKKRFSWFQVNTPKKPPAKKPVLIKQAAVVAVAKPAPVKPRKVASAKRTRTWNVPIRRGPQAQHPGDLFNGRLGNRPANTVVASVQVTRSVPVLPGGYKSLLGEDIVRSRRGFGTPEGRAAMDLLWTRTMPRRLIDVTTGRDMTAKLPQIVYPYVTASTKSYGAVAANAGQAKKRIFRDEAAPFNMTKIQDVSAVTDRRHKAAKVVAKVVSIAPTSRFVQVATFGVAANAKRTLARFDAGGLPTNSRPYTRKGKQYAIVLLGPFQDGVKLAQALKQARTAGFSDAFYVD